MKRQLKGEVTERVAHVTARLFPAPGPAATFGGIQTVEGKECQ